MSCELGKDEIPLKEKIDAAVAGTGIVVLVSVEEGITSCLGQQDVNLEEVSRLRVCQLPNIKKYSIVIAGCHQPFKSHVCLYYCSSMTNVGNGGPR